MSELRVTRLSEPVLPARPVKRAPQSARKQEEENWLLIYARTARKRWLLIVTCTIVCAALSFVALLYQPVVYQGTATLEVLGLNEGFMDAARVDPQGAGNNGATLINMQTQLRLLRSGALLQRVVERLSLEGLSFALVRRDRFSTFRDRLRILPKEPAEQGKRAINMALLTGGGRILTGTRILEVSCESTSPEIAAAFVNTWVNEYLESSLRSRLQSAQKTGQWLTAQLDETKAKLEKAERELQNYANRSGITSPDQSNNSLADSKLQALQKDLASLQADRILKQTRMEKALMNLEALPDLSSDMGLRGDQAQLANLKREQSQLALTLTPVHPRMKALNLQIAALEDSLLRQREKIIGRIKSDYDLAVQSEKLLTSAYTRATSTLATQTSKLVDYNLLKREVDTTRQLYNTMLQQSNQANVVSALPTNTLRVVDYAGVPNESLRPRLSIFLGWGTVTGLFIGFLLALYRQNADSSISAPGIIATTLHMPELAAIPTADSRPGSRPTFALPWGKRTGMEIARPGSLGTIVDPNSFVAQSFHFAVSSLVADKSDGVNPRVIVVNSPHKAEGKTWITSNLAYALANSSRKVLLDRCRPSLSTASFRIGYGAIAWVDGSA